MRRLLVQIGAIVGVCGLLISASSNAIEVRGDVQDVEGRFEERLRQGLRSFLGPETQSVGTVRVRLAPPKKPPSKEEEEDFGYLPLPEKVYETASIQGVPALLEIESVDVEVRFAPTAADEAKQAKEVEDFASSLFSGYRPSVKVSLLKLAPKPHADSKSSEPPLWKTLLPYAAAVLCAVILALGFALISRAMNASASTITGGILQLKANVTGSSDRPAPVQKKPEPVVRKAPEESIRTPQLPSDLVQRSENEAIRVIRQVLRSDAALFTRAVTQSDRDLLGLKRLLPFLEEPEQDALKGALGEHILERISDAEQSSDKTAEMSPSDFSSWARTLAERVVLRRIQGGSLIEKAVGTEGVLELLSARSDQLLEAVRMVDSAGAWRIAAEFLPSSTFRSVVAESEGGQLKSLVDSASLPREQIAAAAKEVLERLHNERTAGMRDRLSRSSRFVETRLLAPVLDVYRAKPFGQDEVYLAAVRRDSPELGQMILERVWSMSEIRRIPGIVWSKTLKELSNEERVALVVSLPSEVSDRIRGLIPEGNARTIVLDRVKRHLAKNDPEQERQALEKARDVIDRLRQAQLQGEFQLDASAGPQVAEAQAAA